MQRICYLALGHICVTLGIIGIILPGMPGVVFFLIAAWAYGRSSERLRQALLNHPRIGPHIRAWEDHHVVPARVKLLAGIVMSVSFLGILLLSHSWQGPTFSGLSMASVYAYLLSKPSKAPDED